MKPEPASPGTDQTPPQKPRPQSIHWGCVLGITGFLLLACCLLAPVGPVPEIIVPFRLIAGWVFFLAKVVPDVRIDWPGVLTGLMAGGLMFAGIHWLGRSLFAARSDGSGASWRGRWTLAAGGLVVVMFVAGISAIGITHQTAWLATMEEPWFSDRSFTHSVSKNNLKQTGLAFHNYHDGESAFPPAGTIDRYGTPLHSWATLLLPYNDQSELFEQINRDLPWDHPDNRNALSTTLPVYLNPAVRDPDHLPSGLARIDYAANSRLIGLGRGRTLDSITDGWQYTILAGEIHAAPTAWGDPANIRDPAAGLVISPTGFGSPPPTGHQFLFCDGSVRSIPEDITPAILKALSTPDGGEEILEEHH